MMAKEKAVVVNETMISKTAMTEPLSHGNRTPISDGTSHIVMRSASHETSHNVPRHGLRGDWQ